MRRQRVRDLLLLNHFHGPLSGFTQRAGNIKTESFRIAHFFINETQITRLQLCPIGKNARALDRVLEFPHIAGPIVSVESGDACIAESHLAATQFFSQLRRETSSQQHHVFVTFAQRRNFNRKDRQPKEKVTAKFSIINCRAQVFVGSSDDAHIDGN